MHYYPATPRIIPLHCSTLIVNYFAACCWWIRYILSSIKTARAHNIRRLVSTRDLSAILDTLKETMCRPCDTFSCCFLNGSGRRAFLCIYLALSFDDVKAIDGNPRWVHRLPHESSLDWIVVQFANKMESFINYACVRPQTWLSFTVFHGIRVTTVKSLLCLMLVTAYLNIWNANQVAFMFRCYFDKIIIGLMNAKQSKAFHFRTNFGSSQFFSLLFCITGSFPDWTFNESVTGLRSFVTSLLARLATSGIEPTRCSKISAYRIGTYVSYVV